MTTAFQACSMAQIIKYFFKPQMERTKTQGIGHFESLSNKCLKKGLLKKSSEKVACEKCFICNKQVSVNRDGTSIGVQ